jgi:hypothetical protein
VPYLGAGVDQHVNTAPVPTWVFTPTPSVSSTLRLFNEGTQIVYVGGINVSPFNGLALYPGARPLELQNTNQTVYTCSNVLPTATGYTMSAAALNAGSTVVTLSTAETLAVGVPVLLGAGGSQEVVVTAGASATAAFTVTTATLYDHKASSLVTVATSTPGQLRVTAGVV